MERWWQDNESLNLIKHQSRKVLQETEDMSLVDLKTGPDIVAETKIDN
jgi:hypothetical protein